MDEFVPCPNWHREGLSPKSAAKSGHCGGLTPHYLLLVATRRRIYAARAIRRRTAPDALVPAGTVPVHLVRSIYAATPVACATAPLAVLFVVAVLVGLVRTVYTATTIARTAAMPTFASHLKTPFVCALYQKCRAATAIIEPCRTCRSCRIRMLILCLSVFSHKGQEKQEMIQLQQSGLMEMRKQGNAFVYYPIPNLLEELPYVTKREKA